MKFLRTAVAITFSTLPLLAPALSAQPAQPVIHIDFNNPGLIPSHWLIELHTDGSAHFHSDRATPDPLIADPTIASLPVIDRQLMLTPQFTGRFFTTARERKFFNIKCESHAKVAFQGTKTLAYSGPDGSGSCQFNYSLDKNIQTLGDSAVALAATIIEGYKLHSLALHDRLGLDREMEYILGAVKDGRLQQIGVISDELQQLAADDALLDRVRRRARQLLTVINEQDAAH